MSKSPLDGLRVRVRFVLDHWWVIPSFAAGLFTWVTFYYAGIRLRRRELILAGSAYSAYSAMLWFATSREELDHSDGASNLAVIAVLIGWIGGALHACSIAGAYEHELNGGRRKGPGRRRRDTAPTAGAPTDTGFGLGNPVGEYLASATPPEAEAPVEANTATDRQLGRLPGLSPDLIERWIAERTRRGGFRDLAELTRALDLAPHQVVRLRTRISFSDPGPQPRRTKHGRVLDV